MRSLLVELDHIASLTLQKDMLSFQSSKLITSVLLEDHSEKHLEVTSTDRHVSKNVGMVSSLVVQQDNGLDIRRNFFFSSDLVDEQDRSLLEGVEHNVSQVLDMSRVASAAVGATTTDHEPVA